MVWLRLERAGKEVPAADAPRVESFPFKTVAPHEWLVERVT